MNRSESSDCSSPGPSKRIKVRKAGAAVYKTKFNHQWIKAYPFIREVKGDPYKFFGTICGRQVACNHQGRHDVEGKVLHQSNVKSLKAQLTLSFRPDSGPLAEKVCGCLCMN